ncbi:MAG TPA: malonic semialdehyde reductase [Alphaproteobacteria bacterium]|nr:malonic semialdehyde reductase [Alphaproteobacteria bacterium]
MTDAPSPAVLETRAAITALRTKISRLGNVEFDLLFRTARTHNAWQNKPVPDALLREIVDIMQIGPTSQNCQPARIVFVRSPEQRAKLAEVASPTNNPKIKAAPVTAIVAYDTKFYENLKRTFPHRPEAADNYRNNAALAEATAFRNGSLQGAYFIIAARAVGLDTGPMSGFNNAKVDELFFAGTSWKSNFLCNLGYGDVSGVMQKLPRLGFDEIVHFI